MSRLLAYLLRAFDLNRCSVCGNNCITDDYGLCASCLSKLATPKHFKCPVCGHMVPDSKTLCGDCRMEPKPWSTTCLVGQYRGLLREMILDFKFSGRLHLGRVLGRMASDALDQDGDLLVPVPLHSLRLRQRGFNQSLELARHISKKTKIPVKNAIIRTRNTRPQMELGKAERKHNIISAFKADPAKVSGKRVILVDDIMTTGATLKECAFELNKANAKKVDILILARA